MTAAYSFARSALADGRSLSAAVPDFLILGAAKCGTTSLHTWLNQHPQVQMCFPKEPVYFELDYSRGPEFYLETYFPGWDGRRRIGDGRAANLYFPWVPGRIKQSNPDAKLIILVRNPIERCLAHWWAEFRRQHEPLHFEEAVLANLQRLRSGIQYETEDAFRRADPVYRLPHYNGAERRAEFCRRRREPAYAANFYRNYVDLGYYAEQIERYRALFPHEQMRIFLAEDLRSRPESVLQHVCGHIGVETDPIRNIECRSQNMQKPMKRSKAIRSWFLLRRRGRSVAYSDVRYRPAIRPEFRRFLAEHFRPHNLALSKLLKRDLSHWS
jgi:hypothetical protein